MPLHTLLYLYSRRLRVHAFQELLAALGLAGAVALVFAVTVANNSITSSASEVVKTLAGPGSLELVSRSPEGMSEGLLQRVEALPGIKQAAPLLEAAGTIDGPGGRHVTVNLLGADVSLGILDGLAHTLPRSALSSGAITVTGSSAEALGITSALVQARGGVQVSLKLWGHTYPLRISSVLGPADIGALAQARGAITSLEYLQQLTRLGHRITRVVVEPMPGRQRADRSELQRIADGRITVTTTDEEIARLAQALAPSDQATLLFGVVAGLLGLLLAFNAVLLTVPERRRAITELRLIGVKRSAIVQMVLLQALCLGVVASFAGLLVGYALSLHVLHQSAGYLSEAFTLGARTVVGVLPVLVAFVGGVLAACAASCAALVEFGGRGASRTDRTGLSQGGVLGKRTLARSAGCTSGLIAFSAAAFLLWPGLALPVCAILALASVLAVPFVLAGALWIAHSVQERRPGLTSLSLALCSLNATTLRSLALVSTGTVAVFGAVALGGARADLLGGIRGFARAFAADGQIWVINPGDTMGTVNFAAEGHVAAIARISGVASVDVTQQEFQDVGSRRLGIASRAPGAGEALLRSQLLEGNAATAVQRLREGGWVTASKQIAGEQHVKLGGTLSVPSPTGTVHLRLAAITTNLGWPGGSIMMSSADYTRAWQTTAPTGIGVDLSPGVNVAATRSAIESTLGPGSGLEVITGEARAQRIADLGTEGLDQIGEIATLLLAVAILAMGTALGSAIWERRRSLAELRLSGARPVQLWRILEIELTLLLAAGALTGAVAGTFGEVAVDRYLKRVAGFPVAAAAPGVRAIELFLIVVGVVLALTLIPSRLASRSSPVLAMKASVGE